MIYNNGRQIIRKNRQKIENGQKKSCKEFFHWDDKHSPIELAKISHSKGDFLIASAIFLHSRVKG